MKLVQKAWVNWKRLTTKIAVWQARTLLTVFYFSILLPVGLIARSFDLLQNKSKVKNTWQMRTKMQDTLVTLQDQA
ncbi:TPA: hypothetical protein DIS61_00395 [Patescibacteria group bacterium]|nr:MAG: hypothetical protein A2699_05315 [Candidatus Gottesmanbacteria bacterium RIFCSPHIGHO2_01_FULL_43_15]HCM37093.1 hypothetical protein [Patescibacteria group bacterium]